MKATITLTKKEIEALQISICAAKIDLQDDIDHLEQHNKTGINSKLINLKKERIIDLEKLFDKLYEAEKTI